MKVSLNYTGRVKLEHHEVHGALISPDSSPFVKVDWDLSAHQIPEDAYIAITVTGNGELVRRSLKNPIEQKGSAQIPVESLRDLGGLKIDFRVVAPDAHGLPIIRFAVMDLAIENEKIDSGKRKSLLPIVTRLDHGTAWSVDIEDGIGPALVLRSNDDLANELLGNPIFLPLVLPSIASGAYLWLFGGNVDGFDEERVRGWRKFFKDLGAPLPSSELADLDEEQDDLRANAAATAQLLSDRFDLNAQLINLLRGNDDV